MSQGFFTGSVPSDVRSSNIRDRFYRAQGLEVPLEVVLTYDPANLVNKEYATTGTPTFYAGNQPNQNPYDSLSLNVLGRYYHTFQVHKAQTSSYSLKMQGSLDGFTWSDISGTTQTTDGIYTFTGIYKYLRLDITAMSLTGGYDNTVDYGVRVVYIGCAP